MLYLDKLYRNWYLVCKYIKGTGMLEVKLLGQFDVFYEGRRLTLPTRNAQSLFAYSAGWPRFLLFTGNHTLVEKTGAIIREWC